MDKETFSKLFNNKVFRQLIFQNIKSIHKDFLKAPTHSWAVISADPYIKAQCGIFDSIKALLDSIKEVKPKRDRINTVLDAIITVGNQQMLEYVFDRLAKSNNTKSQIEISGVPSYAIKFAAQSNRLEMAKYIDNILKEKWGIADESNYHDAVQVSPFSQSMEMLEYIIGKLDFENQSLFPKHRMCINIALGVAAQLGRVDMIEWLDTKCPTMVDFTAPMLLQYALMNTDVNTPFAIIELIMRKSGATFIDYPLIDNAARRDRLDLVKWLHERRISVATSTAMDYAAKNGNLEMIKYIHENIAPSLTKGCTTDAMDQAAQNGNFEVVEWLHKNRTEGCSSRGIDYNKNLDMVKWITENRTESATHMAMDVAAEYGNLELVIYLHNNRTEGCTERAMNSAAGCNSLKVLKWLHENRTEGCSAYAMDWAVKHDNFEMIKFLHENRTEGCTTRSLERAIQENKFEIAKYLHLNRNEGCTKEAFAESLRKDKFEIILWMLENGPNAGMYKTFLADLIKTGVETGQNDLIKKLYTNHLVTDLDLLLNTLQGNGNQSLLEWTLKKKQIQPEQVKVIIESDSDKIKSEHLQILLNYIENYNK